MSRAPRIPETQWEAHKETIQSLYLEQNKTIDEIISLMAEKHQFYASKKQYIRKVTTNWKLRKNTKKEEWEQASSLVLKRKAEGKLTQLTIHGKIVPDKRSKREIRRYAPRDSLQSSVLSRIESVAVHTPPKLHRDITYFTLPWFDLQTQLRSHMLGNGLHPILDRTIASIHDPTASSLSTSRDQTTVEGFIRSLLRSIESGSASKSDPDMTVPAMLESLDEEIPFSYRNKHSTELQSGQSDILGPWSRIFLSMAFLSTNNRWQDETLIKFLELAMSCGLLQDLKQALSMKGPTIKLFSVALLSAAIGIAHGRGFDFVQYLLQQGVNPNSSHSTHTPLQRAVDSKDKGAVRLLLDYGADPFASFTRLQPRGLSQVEIYDNESLAEALVDQASYSFGADPDTGVALRTPLLFAVKAKDEVRARQLLQAGADPNLLHPEELSPLHVAVKRDNATMVSLLIEFGADPNLFCRAEMTTTLKTARSDLSPGYSVSIGTPLQNAVELNHLTIVKRLLQAGADPNGTMHLAMSAHNEKAYYKSDSALTALQIASKRDGPYPAYGCKRQSIFQLLLKAGAGVDTRHTMQPTALQYVCGNKKCGKYRIEISKLLLKWGADVNAPPAHQEEINGKTALEAAAGVGDVDLVEFLLREGATCSNPASMLQLAVTSGRQKLVSFLIGHFPKASLSTLVVDNNWVEYLEAAAKSGNAQLVDMILKKCTDTSTRYFEKHAINAMEAAVARKKSEVLCRLLLSGVNPNADGRGYRILNSAISCGEDAAHCFSLLMSNYTTLRLDPNQPPPGQPTLLWTAIARNEMAVAQCLIVSGADINRTSLCIDKIKGKRLEIPMAQAILCDPCMEDDPDHACPVDLLIMSGANVDDLVDGSMTALLLALKADNHQAAEKLLLHGANPNIRDSKTGLHAFDFALAGEYWDWYTFSLLKSLIVHGFRCNGEFNNGTTIQAVLRNSLKVSWDNNWQIVEMVVGFLIDAGAEVNAPTTDEAPMTALQYAIDANHKEVIDILLAKEADMNAPAFWKKGKTALQTACNDGNLELVKSLVARGVDINAQPASHYGATALQFAAMQGHIEMTIFLLENGALINAPAGLVEGRTALQGAAEHGRLDMIFLLLENDQDDGLEERCQDAARFAEKESRFEIAQILREYRKV